MGDFSASVHEFAASRARGSKHHLLQPGLSGLELLFAVRLQSLAAFVKRDRIFQIDLALLQPGNDPFKLLERHFETERVNRDSDVRFSGRRHAYDFDPATAIDLITQTPSEFVGRAAPGFRHAGSLSWLVMK